MNNHELLKLWKKFRQKKTGQEKKKNWEVKL